MEVAAGLERVELSYDEIVAVESHLHALYLKVVDDAGFNLFILSGGYFSSLKQSLGDRFKLWIYKDRGEIISFFTVLEDGDILDAHFLGYDPEVNAGGQSTILRGIDFGSVPIPKTFSVALSAKF